MNVAQLPGLAKAPVRRAGCKTRLCPPCTPAQAARIAAAALADTLDTVAAATGRRPGPGRRRRPSGPARLDDARRSAATASASGSPTRSPTPARPGTASLLIGMDTPQLTAGLLDDGRWAAGRRGRPDAVLGPAADGGWWALGLREPGARRGRCVGVPTSTPDTGRADPGRAAPARAAGRPAARAARRGHRRRRARGGRARARPDSRFAGGRTPPTWPHDRAYALAAAAERRWRSSTRRCGRADAGRAGRVDPARRRAAASIRFDAGRLVPADTVAGRRRACCGRCTGPTLDVGCGPGPAHRRADRRGPARARHRRQRRRGPAGPAARRDRAAPRRLRPGAGARPLAAPAARRRQHRHRRRPAPAAAPLPRPAGPRRPAARRGAPRRHAGAGPARRTVRDGAGPASGSPLPVGRASPPTTWPRWPTRPRCGCCDTWTEADRWFATLHAGVTAPLAWAGRLRCRPRRRRCGAGRCGPRRSLAAAVDRG